MFIGRDGRALAVDLSEMYPGHSPPPHTTLLYLSDSEVGQEERRNMQDEVARFLNDKLLAGPLHVPSCYWGRKSDVIKGDLAVLKSHIKSKWPRHSTGRPAHVELRR